MSIRAINLTDNATKGLNFAGHDNSIKRSRAQRMAAPVAAAMLVLTPAQTGAITDKDVFIPAQNHIEYVENPQNRGLQGIGDTIDRQTIYRQDYKGYKIYDTYAYVDKDGNPNTFEEVYEGVLSKTPDGRTLRIQNKKISQVANFKVTIMSDDKSVVKKFEDGYILTEKEMNIMPNSIKAVSDKLGTSKNNSDIEFYNENVVLVPNYATKGFKIAQNGTVQNKMKTAKAVDCSKFNRAGGDVITGDNGKYELAYYSENDGNKIKLVTVKKEGCPELAVSENYLISVVMHDSITGFAPLNLALTVLADSEHKPVMLCDRKLAYALGKIYMNDIVSSTAFKCENLKKRYGLVINYGQPDLLTDE